MSVPNRGLIGQPEPRLRSVGITDTIISMNAKQMFPSISLALVAVFALTGCVDKNTAPPTVAETVTVEEKPTETTPSASQPPADATGTEFSTLTLLNTLVVSDAVPDGYQREKFNHWVTQADGCDTRETVLAREVQNGTRNACDVTGQWVSLYDGKKFTVPSELDIDHMVPLKEAWVSGANTWSDYTREAYANDLDGAYSLIAVSASSNRSKSDKDPAQWMPPTMDGCEYVARWVSVKHRWSLTVDTAEKNKILSVLSWCGGDYTLDGTGFRVPIIVDDAEETIVPSANPPTETGELDPQYSTCKEANANGYGPYINGTNPEYEWYQDRDGDGSVCE